MEILLDVATVCMGLAVIGSYIWSTKYHFSSDHIPAGAVVISVAVIVTGLFLAASMFMQEQPVPVILAGMTLQALSGALFWWAIATTRRARLRYAFDEGGPRGLVLEGPYRHVRHPFYASYLLFWTGWSVAAASAWALLPLAGFLVIYTVAARREEDLFAGSPMAEAYEDYRSRTGFFTPRLFAAREPVTGRA
jgi:protein-S-isoprenylcysteine O-methyltransferase Ste14